MKHLLLTLTIILSALTLSAQKNQLQRAIRGVVVDSTNRQKLAYVTVAIADSVTKQPVKSILTNADGTFELRLTDGKFGLLTLTSIGYVSKTFFLKQADTLINLGEILLSASTQQLKEVAVSGVKPVIKQEVDRFVYDVQADPESKVMTGLDMMRKVPMLTVDINDAILLKGNANYKILLNGKESAMMTNNPTDILKSIPAINIDKIEVITTPPAKYDAEGLAGIINIITKKQVGQGYTVALNGRYNNVWGPGFTLSTTAKQGKFGISASANYNKVNSHDYLFENIQSFASGNSLIQSGANIYGRNTKYITTDLSYEIDSLNLITGTFSYSTQDNHNNINAIQNGFNGSGNLTQQFNNSSIGNKDYRGATFAVNYQLGFKNNKAHLLTLSYKYDGYPSVKETYTNTISGRFNYPQALQPDFMQNDQTGSKEHTVQIDYVHPLKTITIEAGTKAILRHNFSNYELSDRDSLSDQYVPNGLHTNDFNYHQNIYSIYNSYQATFSSWSVKAGLRAEHTIITADFFNSGGNINQDYTNIIPSISLQKKLEESAFNIGFTQRILRPGISQLNPYIDNSDPKFISTGNPNLRPELNNTFELGYNHSAKANFNVGIGYAFSNNSIQTVTDLQIVKNQNQLLDTVTNTTFKNLGSNRTLDVNFNVGYNLTSKLTSNFNGRLARVWLQGVFEGQRYQNSGYTGNAFGSLNYKFNDAYKAGLDAGFISSNVTLQGITSSYVYTSLSISKDFLNKKANISVIGNNLLTPTLQFHAITNTPQFRQEYINNNPYRTFRIAFSYKLGKLKSEIRKNQHEIINDDLKGS